MQHYDIALCGAGPVGLTLALLLIKRGICAQKIVLIDAKTVEQASQDQRSIALSFGSQQILQSVSAWPVRSTEIHQIHVSRKGHFGRTLIDRATQKVPALGYVARYGDIIEPLAALIPPELTVLRPATVASITDNETGAEIVLNDNQSISAKIVVQAEGKSAQSTEHDYQQTALVAHVTTSAPIAARAFERFTDEGPLALLPQENGYALVWCMQPGNAAQFLALDTSAFLNELQSAFGARLGKFLTSTPRAAFPLTLNTQTSPPNGHCIRIGNAAQTLHPVAGQGLNLGLRDAFELARFLGRSIEPASLQQFFKARLGDRKTTIQLTDQLAQLFINDSQSGIKQSFLGAGLGLLDILTPAQHWLAEKMMFGRR